LKNVTVLKYNKLGILKKVMIEPWCTHCVTWCL